MTKRVALTFDDGPDTSVSDVTNKLLDVLRINNVRATFFCVGKQMEADTRNTVKAAFDDGHMICNHSWSHAYPINPDWLAITKDETKLTQELKQTNVDIQKITGAPARIYRAPYGELGNFGNNVAKALNMLLVGWNNDTNDWDENITQDSIKATIINAQDGSDILMHCTLKDTKNPLKTVNAVKDAIVQLGANCTYVTVLELENPVVPIYEYYADGSDGRRYNYNTANQSVGAGWTRTNSPAFYACASATDNTKPFYRYHRVDAGGFWYLDYYDTNASRNSWNLDTIWWYGYSQQKAGLLPVYAERTGINNNIRLTTNSNSKGTLVFYG